VDVVLTGILRPSLCRARTEANGGHRHRQERRRLTRLLLTNEIRRAAPAWLRTLRLIIGEDCLIGGLGAPKGIPLGRHFLHQFQKNQKQPFSHHHLMLKESANVVCEFPKSNIELASSSIFCDSFTPPDPLVEGIIMRGFIYALTAPTGRGKTAIALHIAHCVALGRKVGDLEVEKGRVLFLAGENPVDVQMRWIAMAQQLDFDRDSIDVKFLTKRIKLSDSMDDLRSAIAKDGGFDLIVVDSSFAFFEGEDENSNAQQGAHAARLRELTTMRGNPAVLILCHPTKNASDDNLQPRGGGAYVAEIDGNLTITLNNGIPSLHWQTKFRGPDFTPVAFQLRSVTHQELKTANGKPIKTVVATVLSGAEQEALEDAAYRDEDSLLHIIGKHPGKSLAEYGKLLGWAGKNGEPNKTKVYRIVQRLKRTKLVDEAHKKLQLTAKGDKALKAARLTLKRSRNGRANRFKIVSATFQPKRENDRFRNANKYGHICSVTVKRFTKIMGGFSPIINTFDRFVSSISLGVKR
jgi:hypothetical protein